MWKSKRLRSHIGIAFVPILALATVVLASPSLFLNVEEVKRNNTCISNLKDCAVALSCYLSDWDAGLPSSAIVKSSPAQSDIVKFLTAKDVWPPLKTTKPCTWAQFLYPYLSPGDVICPSDVPRSRVSYWWKYAIDLEARSGRGNERYFAYPADQVFLYEHAGWHTGDAAGIKSGLKINVVYFDSHTKNITVQNGPTSYASSTDERGGIAALRLGEPMYFNYDVTTATRCSGVANYTYATRYADSF